jgi:hypothetical protein
MFPNEKRKVFSLSRERMFSHNQLKTLTLVLPPLWYSQNFCPTLVTVPNGKTATNRARQDDGIWLSDC